MGWLDIHCSINLVNCQTAVYLFHGGARIFHRIKRFLVDIRGFNAVDLLFDLSNLRKGLVVAALVDLFPA